MTQDTVHTHNTVQTAGEDNVVTRAQQGHLTLLDWQIANPLQEQARMPKAQRRGKVDWYTLGVMALTASAALASVDLLLHMAG